MDPRPVEWCLIGAIFLVLGAILISDWRGSAKKEKKDNEQRIEPW